MPQAGYLPSEYELYALYNKSVAQAQILRQLSWMTFSVILSERYKKFLEGANLLGDDLDFVIDGVVGDMNPAKMQEIKIVKFGKSHLLDNTRTQKNFNLQANNLGANSMTSRAVLYDINGDYYVGGFQLLEYNGSWLITALYDILIGQSGFGTLVKVNSEAEFKAMLK